jgi:hypothetical protein
MKKLLVPPGYLLLGAEHLTPKPRTSVSHTEHSPDNFLTEASLSFSAMGPRP